jgi:hypothetical protein
MMTAFHRISLSFVSVDFELPTRAVGDLGEAAAGQMETTNESLRYFRFCREFHTQIESTAWSKGVLRGNDRSDVM